MLLTQASKDMPKLVQSGFKRTQDNHWQSGYVEFLDPQTRANKGTRVIPKSRTQGDQSSRLLFLLLQRGTKSGASDSG
jgi:hypothetical protein